ncbi:TerC family protein [Paenibacillus sp. FJAT-26967]|uniref:TerC family protein n=1 Tax=Paenibacillus sp. FJAT-26967 TaxID=1729690 RepID=UPI000837C817|nr:TerC family protein [Paenibacillus sp. FJAT-26967]
MLEQIGMFLQIMLINIVLSGDNAVVIAMASKNLPGAQRRQAVWWGAFGAIALRLLLTIVAVSVLQVPFIQAAGSLLLLWIALKLLIDNESHSSIPQASSLSKAVWTIVVADFVMSLDNVLAIAAAAGNNLTVLILGIGLSIPIIIWGSAVVVELLAKFPILIYIGAAILGYTAGEMFLSDSRTSGWVLGSLPHWPVPFIAAGFVVIAGLLRKWLFTQKSNTAY